MVLAHLLTSSGSMAHWLPGSSRLNMNITRFLDFWFSRFLVLCPSGSAVSAQQGWLCIFCLLFRSDRDIIFHSTIYNGNCNCIFSDIDDSPIVFYHAAVVKKPDCTLVVLRFKMNLTRNIRSGSTQAVHTASLCVIEKNCSGTCEIRRAFL